MEKRKLGIYAAMAVPAIALTVFAGTLMAGTVFAQDSEDDSSYPAIVTNLAEALGVTEEEVQQVFDDTQTEQRAERLDQLVEDGTITEEQKALILAKETDIETTIEDINNQELTADNRIKAMQTLREEVQTWADENDIPEDIIQMGNMGGHGGPRGMGPGGRQF